MTESKELVDVRCSDCNIIVGQYVEGSKGIVYLKCRRCKKIKPYVIPIENI